jgi:hypothetical protein
VGNRHTHHFLHDLTEYSCSQPRLYTIILHFYDGFGVSKVVKLVTMSRAVCHNQAMTERQQDPNPPPGTTSSTPRRPIFQTETTGDYWSDVREAFKVTSRALSLTVPTVRED